MPNPTEIDYIEEPIVKASIMTPTEYVGNIMELTTERRGVFINMDYIEDTRVLMTYEIPLNEVIYDFFDALKSRTRGYASLDYEILGYKKSNLVKLDIYMNGDIVDALSLIVHNDKAYTRGRKMAESLKIRYRGISLKYLFKPVLAVKSSLARLLKHIEKTFLQNVTEETYQERKSFLKNKKKVKRKCDSLVA